MADTNTTSLPRNAGTTLGFSGTINQGGFITGEDYNRDLTGKAGIKMYDIMRRSDSTVRRTLQICKLPILSSQKEIQPASTDDEDVFRANFIKRELFERNVKYKQFEREALTFFDFGHSVFEETLELTVFEGRTLIGIKAIDSRKQTSIYNWETIDHKPGITQMVMAEKVSIPRAKLVVFTHDKEGENYEGTSLLRSAYKDWNVKDKLIIMNAIALEKLACGVATIKKDNTVNVTNAEIAKVRNALRNMHANEESYLEIPAGLIIEMLDLKGGQTKDVLPTVQYHDRQIVGSVLAQFTELGGSKGSGSNALSKDQSALFMKSEEAADQILVDAINEDVIKQLCDLNFSDNDKRGYPKIVGGNIADDDITTMSTAIAALMGANAITATVETEQHIRKTMKLPELSEDDVAAYEEKQKQAADAAKAAAEAALNPTPGVDPKTGKPTVPAKDPAKDPTLKKSPTDAPSKKPLKVKASAIEDLLDTSREFKRRINVIFAD